MDTTKIILINAFKAYIGIVIYFFIMKFLGLDDRVEFRFLNFLFILWGANSAIKKNILYNQNKAYLPNMGIGFATSFLAVIMAIVSLVIYITNIDPELLRVMENSLIWGNQLSLAKVIFAIAVEGAASSVICSFVIMQYWKNYKKT